MFYVRIISYQNKLLSHIITASLLWTQPLVPFIYNRPAPVIDAPTVQSR